MNDLMARRLKIIQSWKISTGKKYMLKHLQGESLTHKQAIHAFCADCMGGHEDGRDDCLNPACPIYPFMPYQKTVQRIKRASTMKGMKLSPEHLAKLKAGRKRQRQERMP